MYTQRAPYPPITLHARHPRPPRCTHPTPTNTAHVRGIASLNGRRPVGSPYNGLAYCESFPRGAANASQYLAQVLAGCCLQVPRSIRQPPALPMPCCCKTPCCWQPVISMVLGCCEQLYTLWVRWVLWWAACKGHRQPGVVVPACTWCSC
jgi:hypothetical protein